MEQLKPLTFNKRVAAEVRAELGRQNMSQAALAGQLGWVQSQLSRRLRGVVAFSTDEIERIALWLDVPIEQLVREPSTAPGVMRLHEEDRRRQIVAARKLPRPAARDPKGSRAGDPRHMTIGPPRAVVRTGTDS